MEVKQAFRFISQILVVLLKTISIDISMSMIYANRVPILLHLTRIKRVNVSSLAILANNKIFLGLPPASESPIMS